MAQEEPLLKPPQWRKIILFNGPSRCGKSLGADCVAAFVRRNAPWTNPRVMDFAEPLKKAAHALFCAFHGWSYYDSKEGEHAKSLDNGDFLGLSPRAAYIALHEEFLKPKFGPSALGFLMRKRMVRENSTQVFIIPNSGFVDELDPLVKFVGAKNIMIIEVHAAEKTFEGDSRSYVGDACKERWSDITLKRLPNIFGTQEDKDFYKMLCEGATKNFLKIEEKE